MDAFPDTSTPGIFDANCFIFCLSGYFGLHWLPIMLKRGKVRGRFGIEGNGCTDCLVSRRCWECHVVARADRCVVDQAACFCLPCATAQMEMEVKGRAEKEQGREMGYSQPPGMQYQAPAPAHMV